ncbi:N-acetyl-gamma-glutamyl-phosphate reductase [Nitrospirota bacterium]
MLRVAICGGSGYTGAELLRILSGHPKVEIKAVTSEKSAGKSPADLFPHLHRYSGLKFEPLDKVKLLRKADLFFMALPHGASQEAVAYFHKKGKKVVDLSADYRLSDPGVYESWYKTIHTQKAALKEAVYGLPEIYRKQIKRATLVANPGCYPTSAILGLAPLLREGLVSAEGITVDSKSGTTGAGRKADVALSFCEVNEGFKAYGLCVHRHTPEIEQELSAASGSEVNINFTPHLLPIDRGILSTIYARHTGRGGLKKIHDTLNVAYGKEQFVRVLEAGAYPNVLHVRGSNECHIGCALNERTGTVIVVSAIDNLVKGASGQAVQNMNLMCGFKETTALTGAALCP